MASQLTLIDETGGDWRLDDRTREIGRLGVASARQALRQAEARAAEARAAGRHTAGGRAA